MTCATSGLLLLRVGGSLGSLPHDLQNHLLILGAIVVNLLSEVGHEGAGRHGRGAVGIELRPRAHPPGSRNHRGEAVVGMEVRMAHAMWQPLDLDDVPAWL